VTITREITSDNATEEITLLLLVMSMAQLGAIKLLFEPATPISWLPAQLYFSVPPQFLQDSSGLCRIASQSFNIVSQSCQAWQSWAELGRAWQDLSRVWQDLAGFRQSLAGFNLNYEKM